MNEPTHPTIQELYRALPAAWHEADVLVRHAAGELDAASAARIERDLAHAPENAALARVLKDLRPDSEQLVAELAATACARHRAHRRNRAQRGTRLRQRAPWFSVAAALLLAIGAWSWHSAWHVDGAGHAPVVAEDSIFDSGMDGHASVAAGDDEIFRAGFNGSS